MQALTGVAAAFDRRLDASSRAPVAVAVSGGGDSLAALIAAKAWADGVGRPVLALSVDHGLQADSARWTAFAGEAAARLGCGFRALRWEGEKPARGLPAAARAARHRLIADVAREAGASVVVFGHTADDLLESAAMRAEGLRLGDPAEWAPSPAWPEGRGVFLLRPLLGMRRGEIRTVLAAEGWSWVDDPANEDARSPRARARRSLQSPPPRWGRVGWGCALPSRGEERGWTLASIRDPPPDPCATLPPNPPPSRGRALEGWLDFDRHISKRALAAALLSVSGGERPPRGDRLDALIAKLQGDGPIVATLGGCRIEANGRIAVYRDAGESTRGGLAPMTLIPNQSAVWDGRYEIETPHPDLTVRALKGLAAQLPRLERERLKAVPAAARPSLPVVVNAASTLSCPILAEAPLARVRALARGRMLGALGALADEAALRDGGNGGGVLSWGPVSEGRDVDESA